MRRNAAYWIDKLRLSRHVEGGHFRETYRSADTHPTTDGTFFPAGRSFSTNIYFLLEQEQFSAFHTIKSDETWHFYAGDTLHIFEIEPDGRLVTHKLGNNPDNNEHLQIVISAGSWFASRVAPGGEYTLAGCTVAPGFSFEDFELATAAALTNTFPMHEELIRQLTYS
jgi:uncharacterized protein